MRVTVFDYGAGNLHSLIKALTGAGRTVAVESDPRQLLQGDLLVLPGVGSFSQAATRLEPVRRDVRAALRDGHACLGICLGLQLLLDHSEEGAGQGLGLLAGGVARIRAATVPHMGWNRIEPAEAAVQEPAPPALGYFAHSYVCRLEDSRCATAWTTHQSDRFPAVVRTARTLGVQFHPEKSGVPGVRFLQHALGRLEAGAA
jgi:imidazole glycerol-phosphate synthase subunit HisH